MKSLIIAAALILVTGVALGGCGPVMAIPPSVSMDAPAEVRGTETYTLNPGDSVKLTVYGEDTLNGTYALDPAGTMTVPLIGQVEAGGLTKEDLQTKIAKALVSAKYLTKPLVTVDIIAMRPFYILGEVKNPGSYPYQPSLDVLKAVATAGGYTPRAAKGRILIDRGTGNSRQRLNAIESTPVLPGDSITVRERIF